MKTFQFKGLLQNNKWIAVYNKPPIEEIYVKSIIDFIEKKGK